MPSEPVGPRLRALRQAAGRTVASVATDAGLSVPYVANLENGRGNPTTSALSRLATALGTELVVDFVPPGSTPSEDAVAVPPSLVRLSRSRRFRVAVDGIAAASDTHPSDVSPALVLALGRLAEALGREPGEHDWWRLLDALTLIASHPA